VVLDVVGGGVLEVLMIVEEVELVVSEELVETGGGLLLAIELDDGIEVLEGDGDAWVDVVGTPVIVLVELVDIVNCLLKTSFLGRLKQGSTYADYAATTQQAWVLGGECLKQKRRCFVFWKERRTCSWRSSTALSLVG
jgi:hypothetical protein